MLLTANSDIFVSNCWSFHFKCFLLIEQVSVPFIPIKHISLYLPLYGFYILISLLYTFACAVPIACIVQTLVRTTRGGGRGEMEWGIGEVSYRLLGKDNLPRHFSLAWFVARICYRCSECRACQNIVASSGTNARSNIKELVRF